MGSTHDHAIHGTAGIADRAAAACAPNREAASPAQAYRRPRVYLLGTAANLVRNDATGARRDGSPNGWWIRA